MNNTQRVEVDDRATPQLTVADIQAFEPEAKIGILATVTPEGAPHVTLITSLRAKSPTELMFGQFCEGRSKGNLRSNPRVAFAVMSAQREVWRGTARWTRSAQEGEDYVAYNRLPMFRYNAYFGIHTVHYMDLVDLVGPTRLSLPATVAGSVVAALRGKARRRSMPTATVFNPWTRAHLAQLDTMKFLAFVADDGFPRLLPIVPAAPVEDGRVVLVGAGMADELQSIGADAPVALFALNLKMQSVLLRGKYSGFRRVTGLPVASIHVDWVYNSMPPLPGQVYPPQSLTAVTNFD